MADGVTADAEGFADLERRLRDLEPPVRELDWNAEQLADALASVGRVASAFLGGRDGARAFSTAPPLSLKASFGTPLGAAAALEELAGQLERGGIDTASPGFMGYIPGGGLPVAAAAGFVTSLLNRYVGIYAAAPGAAEVENQVVGWLCRLFRLPETAWGTLTSGGSVATITAFVAARDAAPTAQRSQLVCYLTEEAHYANRRALHVVGLGAENVRIIGTDRACRMDVEALRRAVADDRAAGAVPWMVVATAGTTNTGAIDPLPALAAFCAASALWFHVDAAYGGLFALVPDMAPALGALARADSLVVDPHKGMFLPYGCGAVLVAKGERLRASLAAGASYTSDLDEPDLRSANDYSVELTRPPRGAQIWAVLQAHGEAAIGAALLEKRLLARWLYRKMRASQRFEMANDPELTAVVFCCLDGDAATARLLKAVTARGDFLLSSTRLGGRLFLRCCILCFRTHLEHVEGLLAQLCQ